MSTNDEYMTRRQARDLARRLARLERKQRSTAAAHADLRHSAIDGGRGLVLKDEQGQEKYRLGTDENGVTAPQYKGGPTPEQPSEPFVDVGGEVVKIQHSGLDVNEAPAPGDFRRAQIHVSQDEVFEPDFSTLAGYLEEAAGSFTHRLPGGEWYVGVVWETLSGKRSAMSDTVLADIPPLVDAQDIEDTLAEAEQIIADAVAEAQTQLDELRDRLDNFEEFDPSDLIAQINQVNSDLADARQEAAGLVSDLADQVDDIKIPDVSGFITQAEVDAAATAAETAAKEHADLVAQGAKDDAIAEAEAKANAAREAAEQAAKTYTDQQDIETLEAAAEDATAKADAAQQAAEAEADRLAKAEAQAAEAEAIRQAKADALAQANAARDAAIASASDDATAKADAAQAAAVAYAEAEAAAKAEAAQAEAIRQAAEDATTKANKAREDAEAAANDYADRQDAQVKIDAAQDAQEKADAVRAEAQEALDNLEVGTRNYILNSEKLSTQGGNAGDNTRSLDENGDLVVHSAGDSYISDMGLSASNDHILESFNEGEMTVFSLEMKSSDTTEVPTLYAGTGMGYAALHGEMGPEFSRFYQVRPWNATQWRPHLGLTGIVGDITVRRAKFEKGTKPSDWSPAPEDLQARIDAAQARADEAHAEAGEAWDHADAGLNRAISAESNAIEEAGRLATAAREAAEAEADRLAKAEAQAAQTEAIRQAKADALAQAEAARDAAIASASDDAAAKAQAAQEAAEEYAEAEAQAKADAAQTEAIRQAAEDATAKANAAQTAAENNAKQHADNMPKMLGGTGGPVGTAPDGSVWFQRDEDTNVVEKRWERINGSWIQQEVSGQMIDNLEAGKITALHTEFAESVIGKLWTQLAIVDRLIATSAWIGGAMIGEDAVEAKHIVASETLSGKVAEFLKLNVTDLVATGAQVDDAVIRRLWTDGLVALSATLARATVASQNLIPHPLDPDVRDFFQGGDFGINSGDPSIWVQGRYTATSNGTIRLEADQEYRFTVDAAGSVAGTRYYIDLVPQFDASVNFRRVAQDIEAGTKSDWARHEIEFTVDDTGDYAVKIWANHTNGTDNRDGYQWFRNLKVANKLDGSLVVEDTIRTRHLHVTKDMVGEFAKFMHLVVDQMDVNALWADTAWLTAIETASIRLQTVVDSWTTFISGRGMEVVSPEGQPTVQLGNFDETGLTLYGQDPETGAYEAMTSMTDDGHISGQIIDANEEFYYQGTELSNLLESGDHYPLGVIGDRSFDYERGPYYTETGIGYVGFLAVPGRKYKITATGAIRDQAATLGCFIRLRARTTPGEEHGWPEPSVTSTQVGRTHTERVSNTGIFSFEMTRTWEFPNPDNTELKPTRILLTIAPLRSDGEATWVSGGQIIVEDIGLSPRTNSGWHDGGSSGGTPPAEPTPIKTRQVSTFNMSWWRTWWQNGNIPSSGVGTSELAQGRSPYFTTAGRYRSMVGFPSMTSTLSGADIEKIEVRVRVTHSHSGRGGRVRLGTHGHSSRPSSYSATSSELTNTHFGRGQEKWVTLPSSTHAGFKNGSLRGVVLFTNSTSSDYYIQARPSRMAIRVTYRK